MYKNSFRLREGIIKMKVFFFFQRKKNTRKKSWIVTAEKDSGTKYERKNFKSLETIEHFMLRALMLTQRSETILFIKFGWHRMLCC